uniref:Uncharacterized protein n=1 Tax=Spongospora subterranea TaxID=70186 RepID=A0A0H5QGU2_9EUKA|eukprot:CRZ00817.1 hypothetical protein [Spongospora subterranea]
MFAGQEAFKCMANCLDNEALEGAALDRCSRRCTELLERVKHAVEHDMNELQERVSRGVQLCNDQATDMLGERSEPDPAMRERAEKFADECAAKSLKSHTSFISAIQQRVSRIVE